MDTKNTNNISSNLPSMPLNDELGTANNADNTEQKTNSNYNNKAKQSNFQPNSYNSDIGEKKMDHLQTHYKISEGNEIESDKELMSYPKVQLSPDSKKDGDEDDEEESFDGEGFSGDGDEKDDNEDDERFVDKDDIEVGLKDASNKIMQEIISDLEDYHESLDGIRPTSSENRSLSHEHGGLEVKIVTHDKGGESVSEDVWDDHSEDLEQVADQEDDRLSDTSTSSLRQSFIGTKKRNKKKRGKKHDEIAEEMEEGGLSLLEARGEKKESHVDKLNSQRSSGSKGGGITMF